MEIRNILAIMVLSVFSLVVVRAHADYATADMRTIQDVTRATPTAQDIELNHQVKGALQNDTSLGQAIGGVQLKTVQGVVHLKGTVTSEAERHAIEQKVSSQPGVIQVKNFIHIAA